MESKLKEFLEIGDGFDFSSSFNDGFINGCGFGNGNGDGNGYIFGSGFGYGNGSDFGSGSGFGNGDGSGFGYGFGHDSDFGNGYGSGFGYNIKHYEKYDVYMIDGVQTIIKHIKDNIAKGFILNSDFTLTPCYVVKSGNLFAHGRTLKEATQSLNKKRMAILDTEETINEFCEYFEKGKKYKGSEFFDWHNFLTGSCLMGRESFVRNHRLSLDDDFTVDEFIELTEHDYGGDIIKQLKEVWKNKD